MAPRGRQHRNANDVALAFNFEPTGLLEQAQHAEDVAAQLNHGTATMRGVRICTFATH